MRRWGSLLLALALGCGRIGYDGDAGTDAGAELFCTGSDPCELVCPTGSGCRFRCLGSSQCRATCTTSCVLECGGSAECVLLCDGSEQRCSGSTCTLTCGP